MKENSIKYKSLKARSGRLVGYTLFTTLALFVTANKEQADAAEANQNVQQNINKSSIQIQNVNKSQDNVQTNTNVKTNINNQPNVQNKNNINVSNQTQTNKVVANVEKAQSTLPNVQPKTAPVVNNTQAKQPNTKAVTSSVQNSNSLTTVKAPETNLKTDRKSTNGKATTTQNVRTTYVNYNVKTAVQPAYMSYSTTSSNNEHEKLMNEQKKYNDERLKNVQGNSTFKNTHNDLNHEAILGIQTDRIKYKPGDTVKIYTEYNKSFKKPIYSDAILYSHRRGGWYSEDPPYFFDKTALVGRTTSFYKKPNGNWESEINIQLPKDMVDDAFEMTVSSWNDIEGDYTRSFGDVYNDIVIKVINNSTAPKTGGYKLGAFDQYLEPKEDYESPKIIKYITDKKIYNPNDTVKMTIEMKDRSGIAYMQAQLKTKEPDIYKDGSGKYIPMNFADFTRNIKQLDNGNWQGIIEFKLPSYIQTGDMILEDLTATDEFGNNNELYYDFNKTLFKVERTENVQPFTVEPIADFSKEIRGKATSNMTIYAFANNKQIGKATVVDGKYFMKIPAQKAGTSVQLYTVNKYNNKSKIVTTKVLDRTAPKVPTVTKITTKTKVVSGKGEAGSVVYIYNGKTKIGQATIDTKGNYKLNIKLQKKGTKLTIYALDKAKNKSTVTTIKVG